MTGYEVFWNRVNAVTGPVGMVSAMLALALLVVVLSPWYAAAWLKRKIGWGWRPHAS